MAKASGEAAIEDIARAGMATQPGADPSVMSAAAMIMQLGPEAMGLAPRAEIEQQLKDQNGRQRSGDPTEQQTSSDLEESEDEAATKKAADTDAKGDVVVDDDAEQFIEIPRGEGEEAERIPVAEAVKAIEQVRTFNGGVAAAINRVEAEYQEKQDGVLNEIVQMHETVRQRAEAALRAIPSPRPPSKVYLDRASEHYNPEEYHLRMLDYNEQVKAYELVGAEGKRASEALTQLQAAQIMQHSEREYARLARYPGFEEWADPAKRDVHEAAMLKDLEELYGVKADDLAGVRTHKLFVMARDLIAAKKTAKAAPEIKRQVKERVAKVTKGVAAQPRTSSGQFAPGAQAALKELQTTGSKEAAAAYILRSGLARG